MARLRAGESDVSEYRILGQGGRVLWVRDFTSPLRDRAGRVVGMCGASQNVTGRRRAENALRAIVASTLAATGERVFGTVTESVAEWLEADAVLVGELVEAGRVQTLSLRVDGRPVAGRTFLLAGSACEAVVRDGLVVVPEGSRTRFPTDQELTRLSAESFAGIPLRDSKGRSVGVLVVAWRRALSLPAQAEEALGIIATIAAAELERRCAAREREAMEERLRQSDKMEAIGRLAGGVAHDFNNQLVGIMGYAEILLGRTGDAGLKRYAERILTASRRAADLTRQLLAFARRGQCLSVAVDLHAVIGEVVEMLERSIDKRIRIRQDLGARPCSTVGDPSQLQSALLNVALNGRDAMPDGGDLVFATANEDFDQAQCQARGAEVEPGRYTRISIADTGVGMDAEMLKRVFEPFFTTKEPGKGTGMGLAAVYGTLKAHRGWVDVRSQVGAGTVVSLFLPLVEAPAAVQPLDEGVHAAAGNAHVLVVDDEEVVRSVVAEALGALGYRVTSCADGQECVETYREIWRDVDLVLLDMVMPKMGGHEAFLAIRRCNPDLKVLLCSGYSLSKEARALLAQQGVVGFLQKPFQIPELARLVADALAPK
jgi:signal transduction histidine kinase/ActR/RegA family two-component response regulator